MKIDEAIKRYKSNAFYEKTDGNLQGYLEFNQLAEWLEELKQLREHNEKLINEYISKVGCCDECFASVYCTVNRLRESRVPQDYCEKNIERYFSDKASQTGAEGEG